MSEKLPFAAQEYAPDLIELNDILKDQIRMYNEPADMQAYVDVCLEKIHGNSNLGYVLDTYAEKLAIYYSRFEGRESEQDHFKRIFYAGSILATEVAMKELPEGVSKLFHTFIDEELEVKYSDDLHGKARAVSKLSELAEAHEYGIEPNDIQAVETAALLYAPNADPTLHGFFCLGYRFGSISTCKLVEFYYPDLDEAS